ncbi:MAG: hypothetical protein ACW964_01505 [Candidatus Hodarchaeales archaeon]
MATEQENKISKIKDSKAKIESENNQIKQRIENFQNESKKVANAFNSGMNQSKKKVLNEINSLIAALDSTGREFEEYKKKTLLSDKDALNSRLDNLLGDLTSGVDKLKKAMVDLSTKQESEISSIYSQMAGKVNTGLSDIYSDQRQQISEFEKEISSRLEKIQRDIVSTVESGSTNQREMTESIATSQLESLAEFRAKIRDLSDAKETNVDAIFHGTVSNSVSRLEMAKEDLLASIDGAMAQLDESITNQKLYNSEMQKEIQEAIVSGKSDVKDRIGKHKEEIIAEWKRIQEEQLSALTAEKESTSDSFRSALTSDESYHTVVISELESNLKSSLYNEIDNISLSFTKYQDSIISQIDALISRLTGARDEMKGSLDSLLISNLNKIGGIGKQFETQLASTFTQLTSKSKKTREGIYTSVINVIADRFSEINTTLNQYQEKTSEVLDKTAMDIDVSLMNFFDNTQNNISERVGKNDDILDQLGNSINESFKQLQIGQDKNIETTLTDIKNTLRAKQSELITAISSIAPAAEDHIETNREFIDAKKKEITSTSTATFDDLRNQISSIEQDGITAIKGIINETHAKLDSNVKSSEESTKDLIVGLKDEHTNAIAKYRANATQEFNTNQETLDSYHANLQEKFNQFFDNQQGSLDLFLDSNRTRRDSVDDLRRNIDIKFEELTTGMDTATETLNVNIDTNTQNVTTNIKKIIKSVDDVIKSIK